MPITYEMVARAPAADPGRLPASDEGMLGTLSATSESLGMGRSATDAILFVSAIVATTVLATLGKRWREDMGMMRNFRVVRA